VCAFDEISVPISRGAIARKKTPAVAFEQQRKVASLRRSRDTTHAFVIEPLKLLFTSRHLRCGRDFFLFEPWLLAAALILSTIFGVHVSIFSEAFSRARRS
jgi:hypothetical protein